MSKKLIALICWIAVYPTQIKANEVMERFAVEGTTVSELMANVNANKETPYAAFGFTKLNSHLEWTTTKFSDGTCRLDAVTFEKTITIHMPEWINKEKASQCLQNSWVTVWNNVLLHEERHRDIYLLLDAQRMETRIMERVKTTSCETITDEVNAEYESILNENKRLHAAFHASETTPRLEDC